MFNVFGCDAVLLFGWGFVALLGIRAALIFFRLLNAYTTFRR